MRTIFNFFYNTYEWDFQKVGLIPLFYEDAGWYECHEIRHINDDADGKFEVHS